MFGLPGGYDNTMSPASYMVQGPTPGYTYNMLAFNDTLQQPKNKVENKQTIHPGRMVRGVGYNNPDKKYTGIVHRILKSGDGKKAIGLYIQTLKNAKMVTIRADKNLELLVPENVPQYGGHRLSPSTNLDIGKGTMRGAWT